MDHPTQALAKLAETLSFDDLPGDVVDMAKLCLLDNLGCAFRGAREDLVQILGREIADRGILAQDCLPGRLGVLRPSDKAMLYAAAGHAVDFDDTLTIASTHAGSPVVGSVVALLPHSRSSGKQVLEAIVSGYEVAARIASMLKPEHSLNGLHCTGTVGVFAAAATSAKLLGLSEDQTRTAFGLAATQSAGLKCSFGTMAKPFNAAHAASSGVMAARLAAAGFTASQSSLEDRRGFLTNYVGREDPKDWKVWAPDEFGIRMNAFKLHAACHEIHPALDAISALLIAHDFAGSDVERLTVATSAYSLKVATVGVPKGGLECKFSFSQAAASLLAGLDMAADETYSDAVLHREDVNALRDRVEIKAGDGLRSGEAQIDVQLFSGRTHSLNYDGWEYFPDAATVRPRVEEKFLRLAGGEIGADIARPLMDAVLDLDSANDALLELSI